jgi:ATP-dependent DNA ligase
MPDQLKDEAFAPELAKLVKDPPAGDAWLHEVKWDGYQIVATVLKGKVRLWSRNGIEWTQKVPERPTLRSWKRATRKKAHWFKPTIVAEVFHHGLGGQGLLRHPASKTIRADKAPKDLK